MSMSFVDTKGLSNKTGENNCFLNSAVQILWHLDVFRKNFRLLTNHSCLAESCIFCALKVIFTQFQFSEEKVLPPDALRQALAVAFQDQHKFQLGSMDDAAECFENILSRIHFHLSNGDTGDNCTLDYCIAHFKFGMNLIEQVVCDCGEMSEPLPFVQLVHYVSTNTLVSLSKENKEYSRFGHRLRLAQNDGNLRIECPLKCGKDSHIERTLTNIPDVVSIGLIWDSEQQSTDKIRKIVEEIQTELRIADLFHSIDEEQLKSVEHQLVGIVSYYGMHYSAFLLHSKTKSWMSCDDATVTDLGPKWCDIVEKCCKGRYQPLLLLYQNPNAQPISMKSLPKKTIMLTDYAAKLKVKDIDRNTNQSNGLMAKDDCREPVCQDSCREPASYEKDLEGLGLQLNLSENCNVNNSKRFNVTPTIETTFENKSFQLTSSALPNFNSYRPNVPIGPTPAYVQLRPNMGSIPYPQPSNVYRSSDLPSNMKPFQQRLVPIISHCRPSLSVAHPEWNNSKLNGVWGARETPTTSQMIYGYRTLQQQQQPLFYADERRLLLDSSCNPTGSHGANGMPIFSSGPTVSCSSVNELLADASRDYQKTENQFGAAGCESSGLDETADMMSLSQWSLLEEPNNCSSNLIAMSRVENASSSSLYDNIHDEKYVVEHKNRALKESERGFHFQTRTDMEEHVKQGNEMMQQSLMKEEKEDYHGALICCNHALSLYGVAMKEAMMMMEDIQEKIVIATKRSRNLHQRIVNVNKSPSKDNLMRTFFNQSCQSNNNISSMLCGNEESRKDIYGTSSDLISWEENLPNAKHQLLKNSLHQLYQRQPQQHQN